MYVSNANRSGEEKILGLVQCLSTFSTGYTH